MLDMVRENLGTPDSDTAVLDFFGLAASAVQATLLELRPDGSLLVTIGDRLFNCDVLHSGAGAIPLLAPGDRVLLTYAAGSERPVVLGRIGRYTSQQAQAHVTFEATKSLSLKCGDASIDLRADGKVLIKGEDVTVRAKGTKRIRAGTVSIN
ncbi:MAG: hypothetical protein IPJ08_09035 [Burkholderiales bacterium]|nr:hypothetical protein [Burkholderiales bacterium]